MLNDLLQDAAARAAAQVMDQVARSALRPREVLSVDQWAERHVVIPSQVSRRDGRYRASLTPYMKRLMRLYTHPGVNTITAMMAAQTSKTTFTDICKLYTIARAPAPTLVMFANIDAAREYNQDRFLPLVRACEETRLRMGQSPRDAKSLKLRFDAMTMHFRGSNSRQGRRSISAVRLFCDEIEAYEDPEWVEVFDRVKAGEADYKIILTSTPEMENGPIHASYLEGSRERYHVPCPHCGTYQPLIFSGLVWDGGSSASAAKALKTAHYVCQSRACEGEIFDHHKADMLAAGLWVPEDRTVDDVVKNGEGSAGPGDELAHCSFHLSGLYSPFPASSWGKIAEKWVQNRCRATPDFVRGTLGEPWVKRGERIQDDDVAALCIPEARGGYLLGEVPDGCLAITRAIDWQQDRIYVEDRGWGAGGRSTWLINFMEVPRKLGSALTDVRLPTAYARKQSTATVPIVAEFNDSGHFTEEVYRYVREQRAKGRIVLAVKGHKKAGLLAPPWSFKGQHEIEGVAGIHGTVPLLIVNSDFWKTAAATRIKAARETPKGVGAGQEGEDELGPPVRFYLPENRDSQLDDYLHQITSEHRVEDTGHGKNKGSKWATYTWAKRPGRDANHAWDCLCYNMAGADHCGVRGMPEEGESKPATTKPRPVQRKRKSTWVSRAR